MPYTLMVVMILGFGLFLGKGATRRTYAAICTAAAAATFLFMR